MDLNCDLGEGEPLTKTRALMRSCTSANVACGGHAGNVESMEQCVALAKKIGIHVGAHPGMWDRAGAGRIIVALDADAFELLLLQQIGALKQVCRKTGVRLHHIKLHGALYHLSESDAALRNRYVQCARRWWPELILYVRAGGRLIKPAARSGLEIWGEAFLDRGYWADGNLVPRDEPGALLTNVDEIIRRTAALLAGNPIVAQDGSSLELRPKTLCIHSDSPGSVAALQAAAQVLEVASRRPGKSRRGA